MGIAIKKAAGRLAAPDDLLGALEDNDLDTLPITASHALVAGGLPPHHAHPFDRMLIAQAQTDGHTLVGVDRRFSRYDVAELTASLGRQNSPAATRLRTPSRRLGLPSHHGARRRGERGDRCLVDPAGADARRTAQVVLTRALTTVMKVGRFELLSSLGDFRRRSLDPNEPL
jgi:hypothetical protein